MPADKTDQTIGLKDGRTLAYAEWGDPQGKPVFHFHGSSGLAGLGAVLIGPALSSYYLEITEEQHRSKVVGIKESAVALGGGVGPLLMVGARALTTPQGVFIIAGVVMVAAAGLALAALGTPQRLPDETRDMEWECSDKRTIAAQASLRGVVVRARAVRGE